MAKTIQRKEIGGEGVHVRDCYVWAEIYHLDSPTGYREYLPQDRHRNLANHRWVISDSSRQSLRSVRNLTGSLAAVCFLIAGLIAGWLLYVFLQ